MGDRGLFDIHEVFQPPELFGVAKVEFNGLITNDKFCFTREVRLKLTWWRRALKQRSAASFSATILTGGGGSDEAPMDEVPRSA
jgi:hypothetical protein